MEAARKPDLPARHWVAPVIIASASVEAGQMTAPPLGKLSKIDPRKAWTSEAADFTPWLRDGSGGRLPWGVLPAKSFLALPHLGRSRTLLKLGIRIKSRDPGSPFLGILGCSPASFRRDLGGTTPVRRNAPRLIRPREHADVTGDDVPKVGSVDLRLASPPVHALADYEVPCLVGTTSDVRLQSHRDEPDCGQRVVAPRPLLPGVPA